MTEKEEQVHLSFYVKKEQRSAVRMLAAKRDISVSKLLRQLIQQELLKEESK